MLHCLINQTVFERRETPQSLAYESEAANAQAWTSSAQSSHSREIWNTHSRSSSM